MRRDQLEHTSRTGVPSCGILDVHYGEQVKTIVAHEVDGHAGESLEQHPPVVLEQDGSGLR